MDPQNAEIWKYQPKTKEQLEDLQKRLDEGTKVFGEGLRELMTKVETDFQIRILLGLDRDNPYVIQPTFIPKNIKQYEGQTPNGTTPSGTVEGEPGAAEGAVL